MNNVIADCKTRDFALAYENIFQWDYPTRLLISCVFEVIQAVVVEDEPATLPALVAPALLPEPTLFVGIEERVHQVVTIILRYLERFSSNRLVERLQQLAR